MRIRTMLCAALAISLAGCAFNPSLNLQRSALRGSGDLAATGYLDTVSSTSVDVSKANVMAVAGVFVDVLVNDYVSDMDTTTIGNMIKSRIDPRYYFLVDSMLARCVGVKPSHAIGDTNRKRLLAFAKGVASGAVEYEVPYTQAYVPAPAYYVQPAPIYVQPTYTSPAYTPAPTYTTPVTPELAPQLPPQALKPGTQTVPMGTTFTTPAGDPPLLQVVPVPQNNGQPPLMQITPYAPVNRSRAIPPPEAALPDYPGKLTTIPRGEIKSSQRGVFDESVSGDFPQLQSPESLR
jgi:hypothetical protein